MKYDDLCIYTRNMVFKYIFIFVLFSLFFFYLFFLFFFDVIVSWKNNFHYVYLFRFLDVCFRQDVSFIVALKCLHMPSHAFLLHSYAFTCLHIHPYVSACIHMHSHAFICRHIYIHANQFRPYSLIDNLINRLNIFPKVILDNRKKMNILFYRS